MYTNIVDSVTMNASIFSRVTASPCNNPVSGPTRNAIGTATQMYRFQGTVDEVRVYKTALTTDWIAAEHANLAQPTTFVTAGAEETY